MSFSGSIAFYGFRGGKGGIGHVMLNLMNEMSNYGLDVSILLNNPHIPELDHLDPRIEQIKLGDVSSFKRVVSLARYINDKNPDVILCNREPANRTAVLAKKISNKDVKLAFRVGMPMQQALRRRNFLKRWLRQSYIRFSYHRADVVIANAKGVAEDISVVTGIPFSQIKILPNPTVGPLLFKKAKEDIEHPWLKEGEPPVIMGIGRLAKQKDFPTLIKAFALVNKKRDCRLMILGEGKERRALEQLIEELGISDSVSLYGFCPNPFALLKKASLFVLSSAWEGLPNVLIEAMALGIPLVAADCKSGPREILDGGKYGKLVEVGNVEQMAEAILNTLANPPSKAFLQQGAERYNASKCTYQYIKALGFC